MAEGPYELVVTMETTADLVGCTSCGVRAQAQDRMPVAVRDLSCFGRPARLVWIKRRWRCIDADCEAKTWTEASPHVDAQVVLTRRAGAEACRQVGELARPVATVAAELGVCWWTVMAAVIEHGTPLVDNPDRVGTVTQLGVDEGVVAGGHGLASDAVRHRHGRPRSPHGDRHGERQQRR